MSSSKLSYATIQKTFRCSKVELAQLKSAFKKRALPVHVNHRPFLGQQLSEVDPEGKLREDLWDAVAAGDELFDVLLSGERWGDHRPPGLDKDIQLAKNAILAAINRAVRRQSHKRKRSRSGDRATGDRHVEDSEDAQSPEVRYSKRLRQKTAPQSRPLQHNPALDDPFVSTPGKPSSWEMRFASTIRSTPQRDPHTPTIPSSEVSCVYRRHLHRSHSAPQSAAQRSFSIDRTRSGSPSPPGVRGPEAGATPETIQQVRESPVPSRQPLSVRIQQAVSRQLRDIERRIVELERTVVSNSKLDTEDMARMARVVSRLQEGLARRDAEIKRIREEVEAWIGGLNI